MKPLITSLMAVLFMSAPYLSHAEDSVIKHELYTVAATNDEWTPTNIEVQRGDIILSNELGNKVVVGGYLGAVDANGTPNGIGSLETELAHWK